MWKNDWERGDMSLWWLENTMGYFAWFTFATSAPRRFWCCAEKTKIQLWDTTEAMGPPSPQIHEEPLDAARYLVAVPGEFCCQLPTWLKVYLTLAAASITTWPLLGKKKWQRQCRCPMAIARNCLQVRCDRQGEQGGDAHPFKQPRSHRLLQLKKRRL